MFRSPSKIMEPAASDLGVPVAPQSDLGGDRVVAVEFLGSPPSFCVAAGWREEEGGVRRRWRGWCVGATLPHTVTAARAEPVTDHGAFWEPGWPGRAGTAAPFPWGGLRRTQGVASNGGEHSGPSCPLVVPLRGATLAGVSSGPALSLTQAAAILALSRAQSPAWAPGTGNHSTVSLCPTRETPRPSSCAARRGLHVLSVMGSWWAALGLSRSD